MTDIPIKAPMARYPTIDEVRPALLGAIDAAKYLKQPRVRFLLIRVGWVWTVRAGWPSEMGHHHAELKTDATPMQVAEAARDVIDRYRPDTNTEGK